MLFFGHVCHLIRRRLRLYRMLLHQSMPLKYEAFLAPLRSALGSLRTALITRRLRQLTCDGTRWLWTQEEQLSFERLKEALSTKTTLGYFDPKKLTSIFVDGSPIGLGAVLTQEEESSKEVTPLHLQVARLLPLRQDIPKLIVKLFQSTGQSSDFTGLYMARSSRSSLTTSHWCLCSTTHLPNHRPE